MTASKPTTVTIQPVRSKEDLAAAIDLFRVYATWLEIDLTYQGFETEMSTMPGKYAPPSGELFIARNASGLPIGCVGLRPLHISSNSDFTSTTCCEMKRLYVTPEGRGTGVGTALITKVIQTAKDCGYAEMKLDTLPRMTGAINLYRNAGFEEVEKYYETPLAETVFFRLTLNSIQSN